MHDHQDSRIGLRTAQYYGKDRSEGMREKHTKSISVELRRSVKHCNERSMIIEFNEKPYLRSCLSGCRSSSSSLLPDLHPHSDPDRKVRILRAVPSPSDWNNVDPNQVMLQGVSSNPTTLFDISRASKGNNESDAIPNYQPHQGQFHYRCCHPPRLSTPPSLVNTVVS